MIIRGISTSAKSKAMGTIFITTNLVMTICMIRILYLSLNHIDAIDSQEKISMADQFYRRGLMLFEITTVIE
jgi:hypothetical protein